jgi:carboxypeptidase family protein/TonB-dependent receptor-like protein
MKCKTVFVGLLVILSLPSCLRAQTGSIGGTVTDPSGAAIPKAKITTVNVTTGASRWVETDESGVYRITNLSPGTYDVRIEHPNFSPMLYSHIELSVDQVLTIDAKMPMGGVRAEVRVLGENVAPVDLNDAQIGNLVDSRQIEDLPLILRDPYQLVLLSPGVIQSNTLFAGFSVNGSRERSNNFMLDGADNNDPDMAGFPAGLSVLNPEITQEFRVLTNSYMPEFGRNNGAIIDIVTKRGTNDLHADVYWFGRYTVLSAKDFFAQDRKDDPFVRNQFGYSLSGPIQKSKTFFFANEELWRFSTTLLKTSIVPTKEFKSGLFTYTSQGQSATVDVRAANSPNNATGLSPDPTMAAILKNYPDPNGPPLDGARGILHFPSHSRANSNNVTGRIDHDFSEQAMLSLRYTFNQYSDSNYQHEDFLSGIGGVSTRHHNHNLTAHLTSTAAQGLINELHLAFNRLQFPLTCTDTSLFDQLNGGPDAVGRGKDIPLTGGLAGFGCIFLGDTSDSTRNAGTYTAGDNISWVRGRHTVKTGGEYRGVYSNSANNFASRTITDSAVFSNFGIPSTTGTGFEPGSCSQQQILDCVTLQNLVWALMGGVDFQTQAQFFDSFNNGNRVATDVRGFRQREFAAYAQDSYKIIPNLTFSYGVRYEFFGVPVEVQNRMSSLLVSPDGSGPFTFTQVGEGPGRTPLYQDDWKNVEPRASLAWDPFRTGKTSLRAGYGLYHDRVFGQLVSLLRGDPPFQMLETLPCLGFFVPGGSQGCTLSALFPSLPTFQSSPVASNCPPPGVPCSPILPFLVDSHLRTPYSQNWSAGIQIEPFTSLLLEANYVGSKGTKLLRLVDGNPPQPDRLSQLEAFCMPNNPANMGFNTPTGQCDQTTLQFTNLWLGVNNGSLPPLFGDNNAAANNSAFLQAELFKAIANSTYHALQLNITKRFSRGFSLQGAYTYSHAIDDGADPLIPISNNILFPPYPRNSFNLRAERGNSEFDVTHRLAVNYSWQIPVGHGKKHLEKGAVGTIVGGWTVSGISTFSSGLPFDILANVDTQHSGLDSRPNLNTGVTVTPSSDLRTQTGPSLALFSIAAFGSGGNLGRNHFRGPGINNSDAVLNKQLGIRERVKLDMRFEFYNLFNRVQFNQPDNLLADTTVFGHSTSQTFRPDFTTGARQIQLGMKLSF